MTLSFAIDSLESATKSGNFDVHNDISNIRKILVDEYPIKLSNQEIKEQILYLWNIAVKLSMTIDKYGEADKATLKLSVIPSIRVLVVDVLQLYFTNSEKYLIFYCSVHTYKALLDSGDNENAEKLYNEARELFDKVSQSPEATQTIVQLIIWKCDFLLSQYNSDSALKLLQSFYSQYDIESSYLISYIYEESIYLKSIEWCTFCLNRIEKSEYLKEKWNHQVTTLLVQLLLNNNQPNEAMSYVQKLPSSLNTLYLELKCSILLEEPNENLKQKMISFIQQSKNDYRLLVALCFFVSDNYEKIQNIAISFFTEVINIKNIPIELMKHIWISSIQISCKSNDINFLNSFINIIHDLNNNERKEIAGILWNKALESFDDADFPIATQWMSFSRSFVADDDYQSQSRCFRFMSRCMYESNEFSTALSFVDEAILREPESEHNYLMKYKILKKIGNEKESKEMIQNLLKSSPYLEKFSAVFYTSLSAELYEIKDLQLSLQVLITIFDLNIQIPDDLYPNIIISTFSIIQSIDDLSNSYKIFRIISEHWNININFDKSYHTAFMSLAYNSGILYAQKRKWENSAYCFLCGAKFSGNFIDLKLQCIFKAIESFYKHMKLIIYKEQIQ